MMDTCREYLNGGGGQLFIGRETFCHCSSFCFSAMSHYQRSRDSEQLLKAGQPSKRSKRERERKRDSERETELHDRTFVCVMCSGNEREARARGGVGVG